MLSVGRDVGAWGYDTRLDTGGYLYDSVKPTIHRYNKTRC